MSDPIISFAQVNKWYGNSFHALRDIDLQIAQGERLVICGPSGSGKSTHRALSWTGADPALPLACRPPRSVKASGSPAP